MAARRPIVSISGRRRQLPAGDTLPKEVLPALTASDVGAQPAVAGKGLSAEDYTTLEKTKLAGIDSGAQVNVGTNIAQGTRTANTVLVTSSTGSSATLRAATASLAGVMSAADKAKLEDLASDTGDLTPTLVNSFTQQASGPLRYGRATGFTYIRGQVRRTAVPAGLRVFTLPVGFRPATAVTVLLEMFGEGDFGRVPFSCSVQTNGEVLLMWASAAPIGVPTGPFIFSFGLIFKAA